MTLQNRPTITCPNCNGEGVIEDEECDLCDGDGEIDNRSSDETWKRVLTDFPEAIENDE